MGNSPSQSEFHPPTMLQQQDSIVTPESESGYEIRDEEDVLVHINQSPQHPPILPVDQPQIIAHQPLGLAFLSQEQEPKPCVITTLTLTPAPGGTGPGDEGELFTQICLTESESVPNFHKHETFQKLEQGKAKSELAPNIPPEGNLAEEDEVRKQPHTPKIQPEQIVPQNLEAEFEKTESQPLLNFISLDESKFQRQTQPLPQIQNFTQKLETTEKDEKFKNDALFQTPKIQNVPQTLESSNEPPPQILPQQTTQKSDQTKVRNYKFPQKLESLDEFEALEAAAEEGEGGSPQPLPLPPKQRHADKEKASDPRRLLPNIQNPKEAGNIDNCQMDNSSSDNSYSPTTTTATPTRGDLSMDMEGDELIINKDDDDDNNGGSNGDMDYTRVLGEYEKTLSVYMSKLENMKEQLEVSNQEKLSLLKERDQAVEDLNNVETAFSDVHRKYERSKAVVANFKINEENLLRRDAEFEDKIAARDQQLNMYKETAQEKLQQMYEDYEHQLKEMESENTRLRAQCRLMDMKLKTLENDVLQKAKENSEMRALCDELINGKQNHC